MAESTAREIGRMVDVDGVPVIFGINHDGTVRIDIRGYLSLPGHATADLGREQAEEFARLFAAACWETADG
jgi:hypothetical protein